MQEDAPLLTGAPPHSVREVEDRALLLQVDQRLACPPDMQRRWIQAVYVGATSAGRRLNVYVRQASDVDALAAGMYDSNVVNLWPAYLFLQDGLTYYNNAPLNVDKEYPFVVCWEDVITSMQVFDVARIGRAFALLAASRSGGSLPLKAMFCAEGLLWIGDIRRAT